MQDLVESFKNSGNLHHSYAIEGDRDEVLIELKKFLEKHIKFQTQGNPDFWSNSYETFGIDEARMLKSIQANKAFDERKIFVISLKTITLEAQNSLLKIFEEPTADTHFFVIVESHEIFIPTLRSRLVMLSHAKSLSDAQDGVVSAKNFLSQNGTERLETLKDIIEEKDASQAISFLNNLETSLVHELKAKKYDKTVARACEEILHARMYLRDRAPSVKMILEHIALTTPTFS